MWHVYLCDCKGRLYTGITTGLAHRMKQHEVVLLHSEPCADRDSAVRGRSRSRDGVG